ncbi:MAG: FecR domain-containing protein [Saprospiraceae bacterium]
MNTKNTHQFDADLVQNESFIRWVKSDFEDDNDQWSAYIDDHIDDFSSINAAISLVRQMESSPDVAIDRQMLWSKIEMTLELPAYTDAPTVRSIFSVKYMAGLLAAACIAALIIFLPMFNQVTNIETGVAQERTELLPDGSKIRMNANTKIAFNQKKWNNVRKVKLEGLAFFEVEKGKTFTVETPKGNVTVLGTSFSVDTRYTSFEVVCKTGRVSVHLPSGAEKILTKGDRLTFMDNNLVYVPSDEAHPNNISWLEGVYTFENKPLSFVLGELENQFDVEVNISDELRSVPYTGYFRKADINDALYAITWPLKLQYRLDGKQVFITK